MEKEKLFSRFVSEKGKDQWTQNALLELKSTDLERVIWKTYDGFKVDPYYKQADLENIGHLNSKPGEFPFVRGSKPHDKLNAWIIRQNISIADFEKANLLAVDALKKGAEAVGFKLAKELRSGDFTQNDQGIALNTAEDFHALLKDIYPDQTAVNFCAESASLPIFTLLLENAVSKNIQISDLKGSIDNDPLKELALNGKLCNQRFEEMETIFAKVIAQMPNFDASVVNTHPYHECGASIVQELAFALATGVEYLNRLTPKFTVDDICAHLSFSFSIGSSYFPEIAKLRAARMLWAKIVKNFGGKDENCAMRIHAKTSSWNKTIYDPNVNMLRTTTEAMSAVIGGCESLTVIPYDEPFKEADEFSLRIARNTQLILKEEANLDKIVDPAGGSYYIEKLTDSIAKGSWELFQEIEKTGGMLKALESGLVQSKIQEVKAQRDKNIAFKRDIFLGTNQYPNIAETSKTYEKTTGVNFTLQTTAKLDRNNLIESISKAFQSGSTLQDVLNNLVSKSCDSDYLVEKLSPSRATVPYEKIRMDTEEFTKKSGKRPTVLVAMLGDLTMKKARAAFATNFLGIGGFDLLENNGYESVDQAVIAVVESKSEMALLCASDADYAEIACEFAQKIKASNPKTVVILAGYPVDMITVLKEAGFDEFVHLKADNLETLIKLQKKLGIVE